MSSPLVQLSNRHWFIIVLLRFQPYGSTVLITLMMPNTPVLILSLWTAWRYSFTPLVLQPLFSLGTQYLLFRQHPGLQLQQYHKREDGTRESSAGTTVQGGRISEILPHQRHRRDWSNTRVMVTGMSLWVSTLCYDMRSNQVQIAQWTRLRIRIFHEWIVICHASFEWMQGNIK